MPDSFAEATAFAAIFTVLGILNGASGNPEKFGSLGQQVVACLINIVNDPSAKRPSSVARSIVHETTRAALNEGMIRTIFGNEAINDPNFKFTEAKLNGDNKKETSFTAAHASANAFHIGPGASSGNRKWTSEEGKTYGSVELIIRSDMTLETNPRYIGTYNFGGEKDAHMNIDVNPYFKNGNGNGDPSSLIGRVWTGLRAAPGAWAHDKGFW